MKAFEIRVKCFRQEDGLWRAEAQGIHGCWVDAPTLHEALSQLQEVAAMLLDLAAEQEKPVSVSALDSNDVYEAVLPILPAEHKFKRVSRRAKAATH